jgi:hypothetical protein
MNSDKLTVKISSKIYNSSVNSFIWCVALHRDFILERGQPEVRFKLKVENSKLFVILGDSGSLLSTTKDSNLWVWMAVSNKYCEGLQKPVAKWPAREIEGIYNKEDDIIEVLFPDGMPAMLARAAQGPDEEELDSFRVKPRAPRVASSLHSRPFMKKALPTAQRVNEFPASMVPSLKEGEVQVADVAMLPDKVGLWTDENMRALNRLLQDAQASRRDIVCTFENGIVTIKKIKYENL